MKFKFLEMNSPNAEVLFGFFCENDPNLSLFLTTEKAMQFIHAFEEIILNPEKTSISLDLSISHTGD